MISDSDDDIEPVFITPVRPAAGARPAPVASLALTAMPCPIASQLSRVRGLVKSMPEVSACMQSSIDAVTYLKARATISVLCCLMWCMYLPLIRMSFIQSDLSWTVRVRGAAGQSRIQR